MRYHLIVMGTSLGGLNALRKVLGYLASDFPIPLVIVQHRTKDDDGTLAEILSSYCSLSVLEPDDKQRLSPHCIYLAPANYHLLLERDAFSLSIDPPVCYARPSIDVLFESAAVVYGNALGGILLTGANEDGAHGMAVIHQKGGLTIVEDPASAEAPAMPAAAIALGVATQVLPLDQIGPFLVGLANL